MSTAVLSLELLEKLRLPMAATGAYITLYYSWMLGMLFVRKMWVDEEVKKKWRAGQKDSKARLSLVDFRKLLSEHPTKYILDRTQLNQLEQMPPFLLALWMHALFVDPTRAGQLGLLYTALRALYPFLYQNFPILMAVVTFPNYGIIAYLLVTVLLRAFGMF